MGHVILRVHLVRAIVKAPVKVHVRVIAKAPAKVHVREVALEDVLVALEDVREVALEDAYRHVVMVVHLQVAVWQFVSLWQVRMDKSKKRRVSYG